MTADHTNFWEHCPVPNLSKPSLQGLAWILDDEQSWRDKEMYWDFSIGLAASERSPNQTCGYAGCAMGLANLRWQPKGEHKIIDTGNETALMELRKEIKAILKRRNSEMPDRDADAMTMLTWGALFQHGSMNPHISPGIVSNRIKDFLSNKPIRNE